MGMGMHGPSKSHVPLRPLPQALISRVVGVRLCEMTGGDKRNAIAREAGFTMLVGGRFRGVGCSTCALHHFLHHAHVVYALTVGDSRGDWRGSPCWWVEASRA